MTAASSLARLHVQMRRPGQGPVTGPYWIVLSLSIHKDPLRFSAPSWPFRHPTEEAANVEATRLADTNPGKRFGVFAFTGFTAKVEAPEVVAPTEKVLETVD